MQKFSELPYERIDMPTLKKEYEAQVDLMNNAGNVTDQIKAIKRINQLNDDFSTAQDIVYVRNSIDTRDEFYDKEKTHFDEISPEFQDLEFKYFTALNASKFKDELITEYGKQLFTIAETRVQTFNESIIEDLKAENKLNSEYSKLVASAEIEFDGKTLNLSQLGPYTQSEDRAVRKEASGATYYFVQKNNDKFDKIYDDAVKLRQGIAEKLGFKDYVKLGYLKMQHIDYTPEMVEKFRKQVVDLIVPLAVKIRKRQAKRIGVDSLKFYDTGYKFKSGNPKPKGSPEWIINNAKTMYKELSPETDEFFQFMTKYELMDLVTKKGKDTGGYCTMIPNYGAPFIFSNFNGTSGDIDVLTHEAGHAFQVYSSRHFDVSAYYWPTTEAAEIHSMSMEFFTWPWMGSFFKEDTEKYKFGHLAGGITFLPYGMAVDEYQHHIYENPNMTPQERKDKWLEMEKKYLPDQDWDGHEYLEQGTRWQLQSHIYQMPFYYIDYCLAQICAFQFWVRMQEDFKGAWADYIKLCKAGGSKSFLELVEYAGLKSPFEEGTVETVVASIESWLDKVDDSSF